MTLFNNKMATNCTRYINKKWLPTVADAVAGMARRWHCCGWGPGVTGSCLVINGQQLLQLCDNQQMKHYSNVSQFATENLTIAKHMQSTYECTEAFHGLLRCTYLRKGTV